MSLEYYYLWKPSIFVTINDLSWLHLRNGEKKVNIKKLTDCKIDGVIVNCSIFNDISWASSLEDTLFKEGGLKVLKLIISIDVDNCKLDNSIISMCKSLQCPKLQFCVKVQSVSSLSESANFIQSLLSLVSVTNVLLEVKDRKWSWKSWFDFQKSINFSKKLKLNFRLNDYTVDLDLNRWFGEDIGMISINRRDFDDSMEKVLLSLMMRTRSLIHLELSTIDECGEFVSKIREIAALDKTPHYLYENQDYMDDPMQPLGFNLSLDDYSTFEEDPVKYKLYEDAIAKALVDRVHEDEKETKITTIMVLGAGRGPLATAAYNASIKVDRKIRLYIVEKNPNAFPFLLKLRDSLKSKGISVTLIFQDMRNIDVPYELKVDIFVSELLGSFGDNEVSPECLDAAEKFLKSDGISIPKSYSSYIQPVTAWRLINNFQVDYKDRSWVTNLQSFHAIDDTKLLWTFVHPRNKRKIDNRHRQEKVSFIAREDCVLHGVAGYFSTELYDGIEFNIVPRTHTKSLVSWWPIFFPFKTPKFFRKGESFSVKFERKIHENVKVWYEWSFDNDTPSNVCGLQHPLFLTLD